MWVWVWVCVCVWGGVRYRIRYILSLFPLYFLILYSIRSESSLCSADITRIQTRCKMSPSVRFISLSISINPQIPAKLPGPACGHFVSLIIQTYAK